jgi:hypothetical protein
VRFRQVRLKLSGFAGVDERILRTSGIEEGAGQRQPIRRHPGARENRLGREVDAGIPIPALQAHHAEQMQRIGMSRLALDDLLIKRLGLIKPTGLVIAHRTLKGF